jgi:hypothetical protein
MEQLISKLVTGLSDSQKGHGVVVYGWTHQTLFQQRVSRSNHPSKLHNAMASLSNAVASAHASDPGSAAHYCLLQYLLVVLLYLPFLVIKATV